VYSHESDFDPGLATRLNLSSTRRLFVAYQETIDFIKPKARQKVVVSGNPIRREILQGDASVLSSLFPDAPKDLPLILVLGGSLGAVQLNDLVAQALESLKGLAWVIHQHGNQWKPPDKVPGFYYPFPFLGSELPHLLAGAQLSLARAGAGTLWELAAWKVPALLIPLSQGSRGDQIRNAQYFASLGSAQVLQDPNQEEFILEVKKLVINQELREKMSQAYGILNTQAARIIAKSIGEGLEGLRT